MTQDMRSRKDRRAQRKGTSPGWVQGNFSWGKRGGHGLEWTGSRRWRYRWYYMEWPGQGQSMGTGSMGKRVMRPSQRLSSWSGCECSVASSLLPPHKSACPLYSAQSHDPLVTVFLEITQWQKGSGTHYPLKIKYKIIFYQSYQIYIYLKNSQLYYSISLSIQWTDWHTSDFIN